MSQPPLAERMRPNKLSEMVGQQHLIGQGAVLAAAVASGSIPSMILWGPPGVGKTTLANILAQELHLPFHMISAINAGVKDIRDVIDKATKEVNTILFIDEIHRFSKSQQDALLGAVEKGIVTLIGATTENPSFEVISALLSRCQVFTLKPLDRDDLISLLYKALSQDDLLKDKRVEIKEFDALLKLSGGDARRLLNLFELVISMLGTGKQELTDATVMQAAQKKVALYDKKGEMHYDVISAFIKSIRGSDPNAGIYWLARMIEGGEDVEFIARRLVILASEDIGNANPTAIVMATNCFQAVRVIGYPESDIILAQCVAYLASSPKSNSSYTAIRGAQQLVQQFGDLPVPLPLRNAPTRLMRKEGYSEGYQYAHDFDQNFIEQEFLPAQLAGKTLYDPGINARENELRARLRLLWKEKYKY